MSSMAVLFNAAVVLMFIVGATLVVVGAARTGASLIKTSLVLALASVFVLPWLNLLALETPMWALAVAGLAVVVVAVLRFVSRRRRLRTWLGPTHMGKKLRKERDG